MELEEERRVEPDLDNLRTALQGAWEAGETALALRLAAALAWYWYDHGYRSEARHWLEHVLGCGKSGPDAHNETTPLRNPI